MLLSISSLASSQCLHYRWQRTCHGGEVPILNLAFGNIQISEFYPKQICL